VPRDGWGIFLTLMADLLEEKLVADFEIFKIIQRLILDQKNVLLMGKEGG
jgi:hypothetical protein